VVPVGEDHIDQAAIEALRSRPYSLGWAAAVRFFWEDFLVPAANTMVPWVEDGLDRFEPDVLVVDQQAMAGAIVGNQRGVLWVTFATQMSELLDTTAAFPKIAAWTRQKMTDLQVAFGVPQTRAEATDLRFSDHLVLAFTTREFAGAEAAAGRPNVVFVGPALTDRQPVEGISKSGPLWELLTSDRPSVLVSLGTIDPASGSRFYASTVEALEGSEVQALLVAPRELVGAVPKNIVVADWVPQLAVLDHVDAVVSHAGYNTVVEALAKGLPQVVAPIAFDHPVNAERVVACGAGERISYRRAKAVQIAEAIDTVLTVPSYRDAARQLQGSFRAAGGAMAAADHLEAVMR
jgi:MGT family glycosyltransferase